MPVRTEGEPGKGRLRGWRVPVAVIASAAVFGGAALAEGYNPFASSTTPVASGSATPGTERHVTATPQELIAHPGKYFNGEVVDVKPFSNSNTSPSLDNPGTILYKNNAGQPDSLYGVSGTLYSKSSFEGASMPAIMSPGTEDNIVAAAQGEDGRGKLPTISVKVVELPDGRYAAEIIRATPVFPKNFPFGQ